MAYNKTETEVLKLLEPIAQQNGVSVWDVEFKKEGTGYVLRAYIDRDGGVFIDECEAVSRALEAELDKADLISCGYVLEVSSAGIDRVLKRDSDFLKFLGSKVDIKLYSPLGGEKELTAELTAYRDRTLILDNGGTELALPLEKASVVRLHVDF